ncbi:MAG: glycosyltransferase family 2 protein [Gammaproteobacteria bacterium]|nr:glycosyltransferase family 2 protein [Gammaproteobacteria bacterium]
MNSLSIVLPALNEASGLKGLLPRLRSEFPEAEVLVVDDGSTDETRAVCESAGVRVVSHPCSMGNGAAIKTGARLAQGSVTVFMDSDGQHDPSDIHRLVAKLEQGYDMAVGARDWNTHASLGRRWANAIFNRLASAMTGYQIDDLTSGFRAARTRHFRKFLYLLPNGFSYPTTSTMAFFRSGFPVGYVPIQAGNREGRSKIRWLKDGVRFLVIILKIGALFSPMRLFFPASTGLFSIGVLYYAFTYWTTGRFTNMSALLFISSLLIFLIGILSEQVSSLHYRGVEEDRRRVRRDD